MVNFTLLLNLTPKSPSEVSKRCSFRKIMQTTPNTDMSTLSSGEGRFKTLRFSPQITLKTGWALVYMIFPGIQYNNCIIVIPRNFQTITFPLPHLSTGDKLSDFLIVEELLISLMRHWCIQQRLNVFCKIKIAGSCHWLSLIVQTVIWCKGYSVAVRHRSLKSLGCHVIYKCLWCFVDAAWQCSHGATSQRLPTRGPWKSQTCSSETFD